MNEFPTDESWVPWQRELVEDRTRVWREEAFAPTDAVRIMDEDMTALAPAGREDAPDGEIVPGGWDHEHCSLCWRKISLFPGDGPAGYTEGEEWLCRPCYTAYIIPRLGSS